MRMTRDNGLFQCECLSLAISSLPLNLKWGTGRRSGYMKHYYMYVYIHTCTFCSLCRLSYIITCMYTCTVCSLCRVSCRHVDLLKVFAYYIGPSWTKFGQWCSRSDTWPVHTHIYIVHNQSCTQMSMDWTPGRGRGGVGEEGQDKKYSQYNLSCRKTFQITWANFDRSVWFYSSGQLTHTSALLSSYIYIYIIYIYLLYMGQLQSSGVLLSIDHCQLIVFRSFVLLKQRPVQGQQHFNDSA